MRNFQNKVVVVTGATSGIGRATALAFAAAGARVVGAGRDQARLGELAEHLDCCLSLDLCRPESREIFVAAVLDRYGGVDVLVNNAGIGMFAGLEHTSEAELRRLMEVDFFGTVALAQAFAGSLKARKGVLVQVASVAGLRGYPRHTAYCAAKHALIGWSAALREEWVGSGASVVVVCPPAVDTPFFVNAGYLNFEQDHPGLRRMSAEEVAEALVEATAARRRLVVVGTRAKLLYGLSLVAPGLLERIRRR